MQGSTDRGADRGSRLDRTDAQISRRVEQQGGTVAAFGGAHRVWTLGRAMDEAEGSKESVHPFGQGSF